MNLPGAVLHVNNNYGQTNIKTYLPDAKETNEEIVGETCGKHLGDDEDIGCESWLQHDGHVGGVEKFDGVGAALTTEAVRFDWNLDAESLQVNDNSENDNSGDEVHDVW